MHLVAGGVIKSFLEFLLYSGKLQHNSRIAKLKGHRLPPTKLDNLNHVLVVYKRIIIDDFHQNFRYNKLLHKFEDTNGGKDHHFHRSFNNDYQHLKILKHNTAMLPFILQTFVLLARVQNVRMVQPLLLLPSRCDRHLWTERT
jgi:hypothetical protein